MTNTMKSLASKKYAVKNPLTWTYFADSPKSPDDKVMIGYINSKNERNTSEIIRAMMSLRLTSYERMEIRVTERASVQLNIPIHHHYSGKDTH